ncbi:hypothetical protein [Thermomonas sp.]|uniref:hypothetical protein n=1 Tax=Thermomonas sp. TaxID=1971895 RepID=UPI0026261A7C|nr:hypothetical protein [Thermomonas sp.]MCO5056161.1 hypothetical protein [Thermomonas sp.]
MNWDALAAVSQLFAAIGMMLSVAYLAIQVRAGNTLAKAQSRHSLSEFILTIAAFRAEHADRFARIEHGEDLSEGDLLFRHWSNVQVLLHAETYFHSHALGLMPDSHWRGYARYMSAHVVSSGFAEDWANLGASFSEDFGKWIDALVARLPPVEPRPGVDPPAATPETAV